MSASGACPRCAQRGWLLATLSRRLDFRARDPERFWRLLELTDAEMIDAIGGRHRAELHAAMERREQRRIAGGEDTRMAGCGAEAKSARATGPSSKAMSTQATGLGATAESVPMTGAGADTQSVCRHRSAYPRGLRDNPLAPHALGVLGGVERLNGMLGEPVVAVVGTHRASDYGMETARGLARGLAAAGVTVASGFAEGIAVAAHMGALEARGATFTVTVGGLDRCSPACRRALYRRVSADGCAISEAPPGLPWHYWGVLARARTLALLADLVIVVEAEQRPWEMACAHLARALGKPVAAVPGRVSSPTSSGTNALLMSGASLVRDPRDALDALYCAGAVDAPRETPEPSTALEPRLRGVLEQVGAGRDTLAKLAPHGAESGQVALALTELELRGLLLRGDGGRYVPSAGPV